jgi:hypothetical protein
MKDVPMPDFAIEYFALRTDGRGIATAYVRIGSVRLSAELTVDGHVRILPDNVLFNDELELAIGIAMRDLALAKIAESFSKETARLQKRAEENARRSAL